MEFNKRRDLFRQSYEGAKEGCKEFEIIVNKIIDTVDKNQ